MAEALFPEFYIGDLRVDDYPFSVVRGDGGLDLGSGANLLDVVDSMLQDGEIVASRRTGNRTMTLPLYVEGADLNELANNEDTLIQACELARNTFTLVPGDGFAPSTVFDTFRIQPVHIRNDAEEGHLMRRWDLTIPALPWGRSVDVTTVTDSVLAADLMTSDIGGSVRAPGSLTVTRASGTLIDLFVFSDPAMAEYGYHPDTPATWPLAPAGRYAFYIKPSTTGLTSLTADSILKTTITSNGHDQPLRTRVPAALDANTQWIPLGEATLGGNRDGLVGALTFLNRHKPVGVPEETLHAATELRMFRKVDGVTSLTRCCGAAFARPIVIDAPSLDFERGGVWANGVDILPYTPAWGLHQIAPPETSVFVADSTSGATALDVTLTYHKHWHTYAGE